MESSGGILKSVDNGLVFHEVRCCRNRQFNINPFVYGKCETCSKSMLSPSALAAAAGKALVTLSSSSRIARGIIIFLVLGFDFVGVSDRVGFDDRDTLVFSRAGATFG